MLSLSLSQRFFIMARTKTNISKTSRKSKTVGTQIVTDTTEEPAKNVSGNADETVYIACGMPLGIKFDDVDNGNGGTKTVTFPGVNHALRGKAKGVLLGAGNAVLVAVAKKDWEDIKRKHGRERAFTRMPPLLMEMKSEKEFKARRDEIAEMRTGVEPVNPEEQGVEPAEKE